MWRDPSGLAPEKDKNIYSEKLQGQLIKLRNLSNPIMPGDEYWIYIKDDRDRFSDFYFSAEYDAGFADDSHLRLLGGYGSGGGGDGGGGSTNNSSNGSNGKNVITKKGQSIPRVLMANLGYPLPEKIGSPSYNDGIPELQGEVIPNESYYKTLIDFRLNPSKYEINPFTGEPTGYGGFNPGEAPEYELVLWIGEAKTAELIINGAIKLAPKILTATSSLFLKGAGKGIKALKPLGLGSTGRTIANRIKEQMVMNEILENPSMGKVIIESINDSRWFGWSKMSWYNSSADVEIHYIGKWENGILKAIDDFKFVRGK